MIGNIFWKSIGNDNIAKAIIIKILHQWCPAPVCFGNACIKTDIAETSDRQWNHFRNTRGPWFNCSVLRTYWY